MFNYSFLFINKFTIQLWQDTTRSIRAFKLTIVVTVINLSSNYETIKVK